MPNATTSPSKATILQSYEEETRRLIAARVSIAWPVFLSLISIAGALGIIYFPERAGAIFTLLGVGVALAAAHIGAVHLLPARAPGATVLFMSTVGLAYTVYCVTVRAVAEQCVMGLIIVLAGLVVLFPWGAAAQTVVAAILLTGYTAALAAGMHPVLPGPYGFVAVLLTGVITAMGAYLLNESRFEAYQHAREAERANATKTEFLATASHELRTPLNVIVGYTDLLLERAFQNRLDEEGVLHRIREKSLELLALIEMMLDLNRLEAGRVTLSAEPFRIGHLLSSLRDGLPSGWRKPVVALEWETNDTNAVMDNDRAKVEMILRNLIHNALKFTDQGKVRVTAEVRANGRVRFAVEDTGPGIPAEELPNLFGMFHQGGAAPARGGAGLGLHIVRRFTELLGGEVQVESQPGEGTRFVVDLPLRLEQRV